MNIDGVFIRVEPNEASYDSVDLWPDRPLAEMTVPEIVAACKAVQTVRESLAKEGIRVARTMGETILPGE